jgi:hypothetical protein
MSGSLGRMIVPQAAAERPLLDIYLAFIGVSPVWLFNPQNKRNGGGGDGQPCIETESQFILSSGQGHRFLLNSAVCILNECVRNIRDSLQTYSMHTAQIVLIRTQAVLGLSSLIEITKQKLMKQLQVRLVGNGLSHVTPIWLKA